MSPTTPAPHVKGVSSSESNDVRPALPSWGARLKERVFFDSPVGQRAIAVAEYAKASALFRAGRHLEGWKTLTRLHRANLSRFADERIEARLRRDCESGRLQQVLQEHIASREGEADAEHLSRPQHLLRSHAMIVKSPRGAERGVLLLNYSYTYAAFARVFDVTRIAERYYIVLEPSWCGACDENILLYGFLSAPTFVQTMEPRDVAFLRRSPATLIPVPTAGNFWVNPDLYRPLPEVQKDADVIMVAAWAEYKRHDAFFEALAKARQRGHRLKALLAGYPASLTIADVEGAARARGVRDQIELHESLDPEAVNRLLNRAKSTVLWSRREGFNRAIVEGMFAGLPCLVRQGHNYGDELPHINPQTGRYVSEAELPDALVDMANHAGSYRPREWVLANMTWRHATAILNEHIGQEAQRRGEPWTTPIVGHFSLLHGNRYVDEHDAERFDTDYEWITSTIRPATP